MKTLNQYNVASYARQLLNQHGLYGWTFGFDRAKRRAGKCSYRHQMITISYYFVMRNNDAEIKDVLLHEIAHALAPGHGHDIHWKNVCRRIGVNPERCYDSDKVDMPKGKYSATCGCCRKTYYKHRRSRYGMDAFHCKKCGPIQGKLIFAA